MSILQNCPSCGKSYLEHLGLIGTCKKLQEVTKERDELVSILKEHLMDNPEAEALYCHCALCEKTRSLIYRIEAGRA